MPGQVHVARVDFQQNRAAVAAADFQGGGAAGGEMDVQVSVEVREMERASYAKRVVARQR